VCPLCLGLLQCDSDSPCCVTSRPAALTAAALATSAAVAAPPPLGPERTATFPSLQQAVQAVISEWEFTSFALELKLPAAVAVRAQALRWRLRAELGDDVATAAAAAVAEVKEALKLVHASALARLTGAALDQGAALRLTLSCAVEEAVAAEAQWLASPGHGMPGKKPRSWGRQRHGKVVVEPPNEPLLASAALSNTLAALSREAFLQACPAAAAQLHPPPAPAVLALRASRAPIYVAGLYRKLRRDVPQSPWFVDGARRGRSSVSEEVAAAVLPALEADAYTFLSAGREDIDVRMLGDGRPFALEVRNARRPPAAGEAALAGAVAAVAAAGAGVEVRRLQAAAAAAVAVLREEEQDKRKSYAAVCWASRALTDGDLAGLSARGGLVLAQRTPVRVLHRRANLERPRAVHEIRAERLPGAPQGYFLLTLTTQAGTYIKEFVNGDRGRTRPSVAELLGCEAAECVCLDVTGVELDFL
jgi:tRNA pseudouridine synthase 10